ncbi:MAG: HAD family hydrolase [candidate division KSB1 bacterium]|jgi:2-haloalkanoic acid dehalogenase type II|nr:HAD family hydrolase [candidate division KSB1 bacterium]
MKLKDLKGIIFDVHRTLVDESGFPRERIWKLMRQSGAKVSMPAYYRLYDDLTAKLFDWRLYDDFITIREIHKRRLVAFYNAYDVHRDVDEDVNHLWQCMEKSAMYPEAPGVLNSLAGKLKIALLSNADNDDPLIALLLKQGFHFDAVVTSESVGAYKPGPRIFRRVLEEMYCEKEDVVLVGDSPVSDILGAKKYGIRVIWVNRKGASLDDAFPEPDYEISNLNELFDIVG